MLEETAGAKALMLELVCPRSSKKTSAAGGE